MRRHLLIIPVVCVIVLLVFSCHNTKRQTVTTDNKRVKNTASQQKGKSNSIHAVSATEKNFAESLGLTEKQVKGNKLYSFCDEWYGVPYRYGGCRKSGIDCSCFVNMVYEHVYGQRVGRSSAEIFSQCKQLSIEDAREGDLVFFKINSKTISHVGIFLKKKLFVHASTSRGVIINNLDEAYYKKFFFCAGRLQDV